LSKLAYMAIQIMLNTYHYIIIFVYNVTTCLHFNHVNQIGIDQVVLYCHTIRLYDYIKNICKLSSKKWVRIAYNNYIANLIELPYMAIERSHMTISIIFLNLAQKLVRIVYNIIYTNNISPT
jgi:hypothetical protein